jgi:hypothetical protein
MAVGSAQQAASHPEKWPGARNRYAALAVAEPTFDLAQHHLGQKGLEAYANPVSLAQPRPVLSLAMVGSEFWSFLSLPE